MNPATKRLAERLSWYIGLILALAVFITPLATWLGANHGHLEAFRLLPYILIILSLPFVAYLAITQTKLKKWLVHSWLVRLYVAYILLHLVIGVWSLKRHLVSSSALIDGLILNLSFMGFFFVCLTASSASDWLYRHWLKLTLWPAVAVVGFGWLEKFVLPLGWLSHLGYGPKTTLAYQTVDAANGPARLQSILRGPNPLGTYLSLITPILIAKFWKRWIWLIMSLLATVVVLFYSYSRSAIVATVLASVLFAWWLARRGTRRWMAGLIVLGVVLGGAFVYADRNSPFVQESLFHTKTHSTSQKTSNTVRRSALRQGLKDVGHQPLGRGVGTAGPASAHNNHPARIAENYYVQIAQEVGVAGLVIFIAINLFIGIKLWLVRRDILAKVLLVSLLAISLINMVSHAWADVTLALLWWGLAGVACGRLMLSSKYGAEK